MADASLATADAVQKLWIVTLVVYGVVLVVVAILLILILRAARDIRDGVGAIWNVGQRIANNTIHIPMLNTTNLVAGRILRSAVGIVHATKAIETHAGECAGCPACVLGREWAP